MSQAGDRMSETSWCCPRCQCQHRFVTVEKGPSSTLEYEASICQSCGHVDWRAVALDVVAAFAARSLRGVRLVEPVPEDAASNAPEDAVAPPSAREPAPAPREVETAPGPLVPTPPPFIAPAPVATPRPPMPPPPTWSHGRAPRSKSGRLLLLLLLPSAGLALLWFMRGSNPRGPAGARVEAQPELQPSSAPIDCPERGDVTIEDRKIRLDHGTAITVHKFCKLTLVRCDIKAPVAIDMMDGFASHLIVKQSRIEGSEAAIRLDNGGAVDAQDSRVLGLVRVPSFVSGGVHGVVAIPAAELPGGPHNVDLEALIDLAREVSCLGPKAILTQIEGFLVGSNGRVDLDNPYYKGRIVYRFEGPASDAPPAPARPEGVPLGIPGPAAPPVPRSFHRVVTVSADGMGITETDERSRPALAQAVAPRCSFQQIWDAARTGDAPSDAVATVKYDSGGDRERWWFQIDKTPFGFSFDPKTCKRY